VILDPLLRLEGLLMGSDGLISGVWWLLLSSIDSAIALAVQALGCTHCQSRLDAAHFDRKVGGVASAADGASQHMRLSWCCSREGCRRRVTPPSVRFWGRLGYAGAVVLAMAAEAPKTASGEELRRRVGCSRQSWARWRSRFAGLWQTGTGRAIAGWMPSGDGQRSVSAVLSLWPGEWPHRAARWQLLIHPLTGGPGWENAGLRLGPLGTQRMGLGASLAALMVVARSF
jgi:hypothetical protein